MDALRNPLRNRVQPPRHYGVRRIATVLLGLLVVVSILSACAGTSTTAGTTPTKQASTPSPTATATSAPAQPLPLPPTATATTEPATPTAMPPTPTATPQPAPPTPTSQPTTAPTTPPSTGVNNNPWGYDFNPGTKITDPPANFCDVFKCISSFWSGKGYVVQCVNGDFSKSGGRTGACSKQGGVKQTLYSH